MELCARICLLFAAGFCMLDVVDCPDNPHPISFSERKTMTVQVKSIPGLKKIYNKCSSEVKEFFEHIPALLDKNLPLEVCLAYAFSRLERGQNMAIYLGVVKIHKVNANLADTAVQNHHMSSEDFSSLYKTIFGFDPPSTALSKLNEAKTKARHKVMHGKETKIADIRNAIACVLGYAEEINRQLDEKYDIKPFCDDQRGFAGRSRKFDERTSRFVLKGMGFNLS